jgi:uncharacterized protein (DUF58 family)
VLALAVVLLIVGVGYGSWGLSAAGLFTVTLLFGAYVAFAARAALLWRRYLELVWWLPRAATSEGLLCQRPFEVQMALRNLGPLDLGIGEVRIFSSRCISVESQLQPLPLRPHSQSAGRLTLRALQAGQWTIHGAAVRVWDALGLYTIEAYFPSTLGLKVLPRPQPRVALMASKLHGAAGEERIGAHTLRRRGLGGELRELREYVPGDPFKLIAWKASARAPFGRPLVRELEREMLLVHYILLDIGATMREGRPGQWKLDHALELCLGYAATALADGDRVGFIAFDGELYSQIKPGEGPTLRLKLCERLLDVMNVVEEGFVAMTDGELVAAVSRYLRQQEGLDARVRKPPPIEDQKAWAELAVAPSGDLYSIPQLVAAAKRHLPAPKPGTEPSTQELLLLRQFCRQRGIELPYGQRSSTGRVRGLASALETAAQTGGARVVLISDLLGLGGEQGGDDDGGDGLDRRNEPPQLTRAVALCRRRGLQLICFRPSSRRYLPKDLLNDRAAARAADIFSWELDRQEVRMHRMLARIGFHVLAVGPEDGLAQIFARTSPKPLSS